VTNAIDIDAIPLDLPQQERRPTAVLYTATVETLPDGRVIVMPHYRERVWQWFGKQAPTLAHGPRGQDESKGTSRGAGVGDVGERGRPQRN
jgi:hypothetical protein